MKAGTKLVVRVPYILHRAVKIKATLQKTNMSAVVRSLLQRWLEEEPNEDEEASYEMITSTLIRNPNTEKP